MSDENITPPTTTGYILTPKLSYFGTKTRVEFNANCLRQDKITYNHRKILNIYIVFEISKKNCISSYPTLENYLFGAFTVNENADIISISILDILLALIKKDFFHNLVVELVEMK